MGYGRTPPLSPEGGDEGLSIVGVGRVNSLTEEHSGSVLVTHPIIDLSMEAERRPGARGQNKWRE